MQISKYLYTFRYDNTESDLSKLEARCIFNQEDKNKLLFTNIKVAPSSSAFIKSRLEIISFSEDFSTLIDEIKKESICIEGFKVEYLIFDGDTTRYAERLEKLKDIGYNIHGFPDYHSPTITYALCYFENIWYFGILTKNKFEWHEHKKKPRSYSNSININIAKALVNIAAQGDRKKHLLDACCGVGTIMLEACFAGNNMEGCDINWKICHNARENLAHFNYTANIYRCDIKDIKKSYDAAIIDLPYNLLSSASDSDIFRIIESAAVVANRLVIVSTADITGMINKIGLTITDYCNVSKKGKTRFARKIWVCEKNTTLLDINFKS